MASGTVVSEGGCNDCVKDKKKFVEIKVYTRRTSNKPKKTIIYDNHNGTAAATNITTTGATVPVIASTATSDEDKTGEENVEYYRLNNGNIDKIDNRESNSNAKGAKLTAKKINGASTASIVITSDNNGRDEDKNSNNGVNDENNEKRDSRENQSNERTTEATTPSTTVATATFDAIASGDKDDNIGHQRGNGFIQVMEEESHESTPLASPLAMDNPASCLDGNSNDSSSLNRQLVTMEEVPSEPRAGDFADGNGLVKQVFETSVKMNLASKSKQEIRELRRKLEGELHLVRSLVKKIEAKEGQLGVGCNSSHPSMNLVSDLGLKRVNSDVGSVSIPRESSVIITPTPTPRQTRPLSQLSVSLINSGLGVNEHLEKEKRTPKENPLYSNSEFFLAKDKFPPSESNKKSKSNLRKQGGVEFGRYGIGTKMFKNCGTLLEKLMKHKHGWVFNNPVDVKALGLHDYFTIIKHPMDLGTVKSRLNKNWYKTPDEFAEDVRLTFHNAMRYNPKGQDVHLMAEMLLTVFEDRWAVLKLEYDREMRFAASYDMGVSTPTSRKAPPFRPPALDMRRILDRSESMSYAPVNARPKPVSTTPSSRTPAPKKPKAKDPHKRDMTYEEKQKLSANLQSLPSEKLDNIVQIIKKRNSALFQHDDEIEVDIDSVDAETLWELDRFVTNYKKNLSKNKRKAELALRGRAEKEQRIEEQIPAPVPSEAPKHPTNDGINASSSLPIQPNKQVDDGSRSSSSSSSSSDSGSSSSDSDSDSSSGSESEHGS